MKTRTKVLIFPGGSENALEIHAALCRQVNVTLFGLSSRSDHGELCYQNYRTDFPTIHASDFQTSLHEYVQSHQIDIIFPTHDDVCVALTRLEPSFTNPVSGDVACRIAAPALASTLLCRDKRETYRVLSKFEFCPQVYSDVDAAPFPLFAKPRNAQGGKGAMRLARAQDAAILAAPLNDYVLTEYLPGMELTVDCFSDRHGKLRFVGPRTRERILGGISVRSSTVPCSAEIQSIAQNIHDTIALRGLWYFQLKANAAGAWKLLEVSCRASAGMGVYRALGINFPLLTLMDLSDTDVKIQPIAELGAARFTVDRTLQAKYYYALDFDRIYLDYDDTLVGGGAVFPEVIGFLYRMRQLGKKIVLLTRHAGDLTYDLHRHAISSALFEEIIMVPLNCKKSQFILPERAVFIDNAFAERAEVFAAHVMPCFDVGGVSVLMDWKFQ